VLTGSGTLNTATLTVASPFGFAGPAISPSIDVVEFGPAGSGVLAFSGLTHTQNSFGSGGVTLASSGTGSPVGIALSGAGHDSLYVPSGYSGGLLSGSDTFLSATFASLAVTPGTYVWSWGSGATADSFTLQ